MEPGRNSSPERSLLDGLLHYFSVLFRHRRLILISTSAAFLAATGFSILSLMLPPTQSPLPNLYSAEAAILIQEDIQSGLATSLLEGLGIDARATSAPGRSNGDLVLEILNSKIILDRVIDEFDMISRFRITGNVRGAAREIVRQKSNFVYERNTGILRISFQDIDPEFSRTVVNRMVELLDEWFDVNRGLAVQRERTELEAKIAEVKSTISSLQNRQKELQERYGVLSVEDLGRSQSTLLATLRAQLLLKEIDIKNYSSISKIDDPRLEQLKEERQNLIDLINQNERIVSRTLGVVDGSASLPDVAQEFSQLQLQLGLQERIYNALVPQYEAARLSPGSIFQVIMLADVPDAKSGPMRSRIVMVATLAALAASVLLALLLETVENVRNDPAKRRYFSAPSRGALKEPAKYESLAEKD